MSSESRDHLEGIAIIGMAGRFPGAGHLDAFWHNLRDGVESIRFYSDEELLAAGVAPATLADPQYVKANAALDGVELFDAAFFGMNPSVAQITDPQQRVFLEVAWHALEHAGYDAERFSGDVGVFAGLSINTYLLENIASQRELIESHGLLQAAMANRGDHLATLTAYKLNLRGPAFTIQSTCSTALSSVHLACQALLGYQADMVLAGGVSVRVPQTMGYLFQEGGVASPDGHCRPFDAKARGTVFGSGVGVVVLKRLEEALADGDTIHAVIRGSAANNDGADKIGYTAPSSEGQRRAISMAQAVSGVHPETIGYIECHGTGTVLGDPIEIEALSRVFAAKTQKRQFCAIGSVKSNIGHLDTAAGVAGLIKAALCLREGLIPPTLHYEAPNPQIDFAATPFYVNRELKTWPRPADHPRRAGVSSFGIGGTNVHMVLEEPPAVTPSAPAESWRTLVLSARTASALETQTEQLRAHLAAHPELDIADVAYTLGAGRKVFEQRRALVVRTWADAVEALERLPPERTFTARCAERRRPVAFLCSGLGTQYAGMGRELYEQQPAFREHLDACLRPLERALGADLRSALLSSSPAPGPASTATSATSPLGRAEIAEPALFAFGYALAKTWMTWGVRPESLLGEGIGEYLAACLAGVFSLEDAATLVATRSRLLRKMPAGAMTIVQEDEAALGKLLARGSCSLALVGRPWLCVVSGPPDEIAELEREFGQRGLSWRRLAGDRALQSPHVEAGSTEFAAALGRIAFQRPQIPLLSSVSGAWIQGDELAEQRYWVAQLRRTLQVSAGLTELFRDPRRLLVEIGPARTLLNIARLHPAKAPEHIVVSSLSGAEVGSEVRELTTALARLWVHGAEVEAQPYYGGDAGTPRRRLPLPLYPFEGQRLWLEPQPRQQREQSLPPRRQDPGDWFYVPSWKRTAPLAIVSAGASAGTQALAPTVLLLFMDAGGLGESLAALLERQGHTVLRVGRGSHFRALGAGHYELDPSSATDYRALLQDLKSHGRTPGRIVHLWSAEPHRALGPRWESLPRIEASGFKSLLYLAQALGAAQVAQADNPLEIAVLTSQIFQVVGGEVLCPEKATILGPGMIIEQEYPGLRCRVIDLSLPAPGGPEEERLLGRLVAELTSESNDRVVAYRGPHRWARSYEPVRIEAHAQVPRLRPGGVYLITGGLGGIGFALAESLARATRARLVLLGRTPPPERARWDSILAAEAASPSQASGTAHLIRRLRELEGLGAEVMTVAADVADARRMSEVVAEVHARFGAIHGLIHAAGVPASGAIQIKTDAAAEAVLSPKVRGTLVLDACLAGEPLDFVVYCSSRTTVFGGFGQADYVAANAFLDAYAHYKAETSSTFTVSVDWCSWREVGMLFKAAARLEAPADRARPVPFGHALVERRYPAVNGREIYETVLAVDTHWVLSDHRILGNPVISGTTYLEMVRAVLASRLEGRALELSEIYFLGPLSVRLGERRVVRLELQETEEGYTFEASSRLVDGVDQTAQRHAMGKARLIPDTGEARQDLAALGRRCDRRSKLFTDEDARDEDHGPRWQCFRHVQWGDEEILAILELPAEFAADLDTMHLHPSMLDKSISTGRDFILGEVPYMPYSYKRLVYRRPLQRRIFVHTRSKGTSSRHGETPTFDVTILDESGETLVEVQEFSLKRVNDIGALYKNLARQEARRVSDAPEAGAPARRPNGADNIFRQILQQEGISPAEGVEVFARVLASAGMPQLVVSTRDLAALQAQGMVHTRPALTVAEDIELTPRRERRPRPDLPVPYLAPESPLEETLAAIWGDLLSLERVGVNDNFFDLGGDSLVAIQILSRIKKQLDKDIPIVQLFEASTLRALANVLGATATAPESETSSDSESRGARRRARAIARRQDGDRG